MNSLWMHHGPGLNGAGTNMTDDLGNRYVDAAAKGDFGKLQGLCSEDIEFLGSTPGEAWHVNGWTDTEQALRNLFPSNEKVTQIVEVVHYPIPGRSHISYRLRGNEESYGEFEYEQHAYYESQQGRICRLRVLCSGLYRPG